MASLTLFGAGQILNTMFGNSAIVPTSFYLALITADQIPTPYLAGEELSEPTAASYTRAEMPNTPGVWDNSDDPATIFYSDAINFASAIEDWGMLGYWALCDSIDTGTVYSFGELAVPINVLAGDTVALDPFTFSISIGPFFATPEA